MQDLFQRLLFFCSIFIILTTSCYAQQESYSDVQQAEDRVSELVNCLTGVLWSGKKGIEGEAYLNLLLESDIDLKASGCVQQRNIYYDASDFASYAMGVSLQRKLLTHHEGLNWVDLINGLLRAESGSVKAPNSIIDAQNRNTLLDDSEASQQYLESLAESEDVEEVSGVYFKKLSQPVNRGYGDYTDAELGSADVDSAGNTSESTWIQAFNQKGLCDNVRKTDADQLLVKFYLVKPINQIIDRDDIQNSGVDCIAFRVNDVIRGWRLLMDELDLEIIYDVLIPSELAYGDVGVPGIVEGGENLRFLMQLKVQ